MMKYIFVPEIDIVPEWKKCYYDQKTLTKLVKFIQKVNFYIGQIQKTTIHFETQARITKQLQSLKMSEYLSRCQFQLKSVLHESNKKFYQYSQHLIQTLFYFVQYKQCSLKAKIDRIALYSNYVEHEDYNFNVLIENTFIQVYYLKRMIKFNRENQSRLVRQYQLNLFDYESLYQHEPVCRKMDRMQVLVAKTLSKLEKIYKVNNNKMIEQQISHKISFGDKKKYVRHKQAHLLGFMMGLCFMALAVVLFIKIYHKIQLDTNKTFQADFPIWRGASYFVAFQWILGFGLFFLEQTHLNYKLILNIGGQSLPKSRSLFIDATVTTLIYFFLISLYLLDMAKIIKANFRYYGHIMWLVQIIYFLVPLPFTYYQGKLYFLRLLANTLLVPFAFMSSSIQAIWMSQQLVSFSQPFSDFAYTACKLNDISAKCDMTDVSLAILLTLFSLRIIINSKMLNQRGWILLPPYYGIFRAFSACITAIMSYVYRKYLTDGLFVLFICAAVVSTSLAVYADFRGDWGLLQQNSYALRKNLYFKKKYFYYICMIVDLLLRCNWTLNLSPSVVNNMGIFSFYLIMIIAYFQLIRRGIWNIFWLQCWHIQNCDKFMATIDDSLIELQVKKKCPQNINQSSKNLSTQQIQNRNKAQMQLVSQRIRTRTDMKGQILRFISSYKQKLRQTQRLIKDFGKEQ